MARNAALVFLALGAVSAAAVFWFLPTTGNSVPDEGDGEVVLVGGPNAVTDDVVTDLADVVDAPVERVAGDNRYATAHALAARTDAPEAVVLARGDDFPDALTAAAAGHDVTVVLTEPDTLTDAARAALEGLRPDELLVAGGTSAISEHVAAEAVAAADAAEPVRVAGGDRFETAVEIADELFPDADEAVLARGDDFPDALVGAPLASDRGAPVLLTRDAELPSATRDWLDRRDVDTVTVLGGVDAVRPTVVDELQQVAEQVDRIGGADRYETAHLVSREQRAGGVAAVARGDDFPDALVAGAWAAQRGAPVLLTDQETLPATTAAAVARATAGAALDYVLVPHPDDEMAVWSIVDRSLERGDYPVFVLLTQGEGSSFCEGHGLQLERGERAPQPGGFEGVGTSHCKAQRVDAHFAFLDEAVGDDVDDQGTLALDGPDGDVHDVDWWVGERHARVVFDLGDGDLHADDARWALEQVREHRDLLPHTAEGDVIGGSYYSDRDDAYLHYAHPDHAAVYDIVVGEDLGVPGVQRQAVSPADPRVVETLTIADDRYDELMRNTSGDLGAFQRAYGWLAVDGWPGGRLPEDGVDGGFSQVQSFADGPEE